MDTDVVRDARDGAHGCNLRVRRVLPDGRLDFLSRGHAANRVFKHHINMRPSRSGGSVPHQSASQQFNPLANAIPGQSIFFAYTGIEPDGWGMYDAADVDPGSEIDTAGPGIRTIGGDASVGESCVVRGVSADLSTFQTASSNVVIIIA